jgi:hypothetical protein
VLLMAGEPLNEPIVGYGPFVMNSKTEIAKPFVISTPAASARSKRNKER